MSGINPVIASMPPWRVLPNGARGREGRALWTRSLQLTTVVADVPHRVSPSTSRRPSPPNPLATTSPTAAAAGRRTCSASGPGAGSGVSAGTGTRPPLSPREAWISDGRQGLHFRPTLWDRWSQQLEITRAELLLDRPVPLLDALPSALRSRRWEFNREAALRFWAVQRQQGRLASSIQRALASLPRA